MMLQKLRTACAAGCLARPALPAALDSPKLPLLCSTK